MAAVASVLTTEDSEGVTPSSFKALVRGRQGTADTLTGSFWDREVPEIHTTGCTLEFVYISLGIVCSIDKTIKLKHL